MMQITYQVRELRQRVVFETLHPVVVLLQITEFTLVDVGNQLSSSGNTHFAIEQFFWRRDGN